MTPLHGQHRATEYIRAYLEKPISCAFLLHGPTGTGKTMTAHNLAEGLGVDANDIEYVGQTTDEVRNFAKSFGSRLRDRNWRCVVINECDCMRQDIQKKWFIALFGGMPRSGGGFSRHLSDVQWLHGDTAICCNTPARRSGGRLCWEATCQGRSWSPMRQGRVSPWLRFSAKGLLRSPLIGHRSHTSLNPYAVRQSKIPPNRCPLRSSDPNR